VEEDATINFLVVVPVCAIAEKQVGIAAKRHRNIFLLNVFMDVAVVFAICLEFWKFCGNGKAKANHAICLQRYENRTKTAQFQYIKTQSVISFSFAAYCASPNSADFAMQRRWFSCFAVRLGRRREGRMPYAPTYIPLQSTTNIHRLYNSRKSKTVVFSPMPRKLYLM